MTGRPHIVVAHQNNTPDWVTLLRNHDGRWDVWSSNSSSLHAVVASALKMLQERPSADFTFTTRPAAEVSAQGLIDDPATVEQAVPGAALTIYCGEGPPNDPSMWNVVYRLGGGLSSPGIAGRFRGDELQGEVLTQKLQGWFDHEKHKSFEPANPRDAFNPVRVHRPNHVRELMVRREIGKRARLSRMHSSVARRSRRLSGHRMMSRYGAGRSRALAAKHGRAMIWISMRRRQVEPPTNSR